LKNFFNCYFISHDVYSYSYTYDYRDINSAFILYTEFHDARMKIKLRCSCLNHARVRAHL